MITVAVVVVILCVFLVRRHTLTHLAKFETCSFQVYSRTKNPSLYYNILDTAT